MRDRTISSIHFDFSATASASGIEKSRNESQLVDLWCDQTQSMDCFWLSLAVLSLFFDAIVWGKDKMNELNIETFSLHSIVICCIIHLSQQQRIQMKKKFFFSNKKNKIKMKRIKYLYAFFCCSSIKTYNKELFWTLKHTHTHIILHYTTTDCFDCNRIMRSNTKSDCWNKSQIIAYLKRFRLERIL
jgi:hypothetical protein